MWAARAIRINPTVLTRDAFTPFGEVIETKGSRHDTINDGYAERYHDLAKLDVSEQGGRPLVSIFRGKPRSFPLRIHMMERHPLSSQAFVPLAPMPFLVVVAPAGESPRPEDLRAFVTDGSQGVNYGRGIWHYPLIALHRPGNFLVIDRQGPGTACDEVFFDAVEIMLEAPVASEPRC